MVFTATAAELVRRFRHVRTLVIDDAMLDTYLEGTACSITMLFAASAITASNLLPDIFDIM